MTSYFEKGVLARRREERGEGEVGRVRERVNAFDDRMITDLESFPDSDQPELQSIHQEAVALTEKTRGQVSSKLKEWAKKNTLIKMAVASVGIHGAIALHHFEDPSFQKKWEEPGAVVHLQSKEEQEKVAQRVKERKARINPEAVSSYKAEMSDKLERGEPVTFEDLYFSLEEKNGVLPEDVAEGREGAWKMIEALSANVGNELLEGEIMDIVRGMYGSKDNYDAGQASVTEYFKAYNEGRPPKRNCVTIDRAEQIVFEGIIARLPEQERQKFSVGEMTVKQHKIATLTWRDGSEDRLFPLEPDQPTRTAQPEAGVGKVDAMFLKTSAVADAPIHISAGKGDVPPSPDIDAVTDEPFSSGYVVDGPLIASDFMRAEVERRGIEIENRKGDVMEVEIGLEENPVEQVKSLRAGLPYDPAHRFEAWRMAQRTPEAFQEYLHPTKGTEVVDPKFVTLEFKDMTGWTYDEMRMLLDQSPYSYLSFSAGISDDIRPLFGVNRPTPSGGPEPQFSFEKVTFSPRPGSALPFGELTGKEVERVLNAFPKSEIVLDNALGTIDLMLPAFNALKQARVTDIYFENIPMVHDPEGDSVGGIPQAQIWKEMNEFTSPIHIRALNYFKAMSEHPEYWEYRNIVPDLASEELPVLASLRQAARTAHPTPHQAEILSAMDAQIDFLATHL